MFLSFQYFNCQFHRKFGLRRWRGGSVDWGNFLGKISQNYEAI